MKGLIVAEPWMSLLLSGAKTWEMRTTATAVRGRIALIRKGSGTVVGVAELADSIGPLDAIAWRAHRDKHCIPLERQGETTAWDHAWVVCSAMPLVKPVPYTHPPGAVIWVNLPDEVTSQFVIGHGLPRPAPAARPASAADAVGTATRALPALNAPALVPVAKDGSAFLPGLRRASGYTIGAKGEERVVRQYEQALEELTRMETPRWRRPNSAGNWGIVSGVSWVSANTFQLPSE